MSSLSRTKIELTAMPSIWEDIARGWLDLHLMMIRLLGRCAIVVVSAIVTFIMFTNGLSG